VVRNEGHPDVVQISGGGRPAPGLLLCRHG
jgi:hypothetical protein